MIRPHGCDYCSQTTGNPQGDRLYEIPLSRTPNGDKIKAEICSTCLGEIVAFGIRLIRPAQRVVEDDEQPDQTS